MKRIACFLLAAGLLFALPTNAAERDANGDDAVLVLGDVHGQPVVPGDKTTIIPPSVAWSFSPGDACEAPISPVSNDPGEISAFQAKQMKFMECARHARGDHAQQDLDMSLAAIGNDQTQILNEIHQEQRGITH